MRVTDPDSGRSYVVKRRRRFDDPGPRELTFSCYRRLPFLAKDRTRFWFRDALEVARSACQVHVWAYVIMPEHVHLVVFPIGGRDVAARMSRFLQALKEPVARQAVAYLKDHAADWLERIAVREGSRVRHRFWQPGGGYDRLVTDAAAIRAMIDYIHANPVRRGLVAAAEDWEWSSACWHAGLRPGPIAMDADVLDELQWGEFRRHGVAEN
jgi:putative transposase